MRRSVLLLLLLGAWPHGAAGQTPLPPQSPSLRRWFEFQQFALATRYRFIRNSAEVATSNHMQYREQIRARFNIDATKRYTVNAGFFSGTNFISSWDNLGPGTGTFDGADHQFKQLYLDAAPVDGLDFQGGGLYVTHGESTEYTSYDDDGYLIGGRVSIRRPTMLYLDEITVTRGMLGPLATPSLWQRLDEAGDANYTQFLAGKRFSSMVSASVDYTTYADTDTLRGGIAFRFKAGAPLAALRYEQYVRVSDPDAAGFAMTAERSFTKWLRMQGGYATVDENYGGLNADRIQRGRRFFALGNIPLVGPLSASIFVTHALDADYSLSIKTRFDALLTWDVLNTLRGTGVF